MTSDYARGAFEADELVWADEAAEALARAPGKAPGGNGIGTPGGGGGARLCGAVGAGIDCDGGCRETVEPAHGRGSARTLELLKARADGTKHFLEFGPFATRDFTCTRVRLQAHAPLCLCRALLLAVLALELSPPPRF